MAKHCGSILWFLLWLLCPGIKAEGMTWGHFGFENTTTPNLLTKEASDMAQFPIEGREYDEWQKKWVGLTFENPTNTSCFDFNFVDEATCLQTINRENDEDPKNGYHALSLFLKLQDLTPDKKYLFSLMIKPVDAGKDRISIHVGAHLYDKDNTDIKPLYKYKHGKKYYIADGRWIYLSYLLELSPEEWATVTDETYKTLEFALKVEEHINFVIDAVGLIMVDAPNWKADAETRISKIRYGNLNIINSESVAARVEVTQRRKGYPIGVGVRHNALNGDANDRNVIKYKKWLEDRTRDITWAVLVNALKWPYIEPEQQTFPTGTAVNASIAFLKNLNYNLRGHTVNWNKLSSFPSWVLDLTQSDQIEAINNRTDYITTTYKGVVEHWDVCNECYISQDLEDILGIQDVEKYLMEQVRAIDPDVKLFTNQFNNINSVHYFSETVTNAMVLVDAGLLAPSSGGIGLQAHLNCNDIDYEEMKSRLETLTHLNASVWITEMTVRAEDEDERADCFENAFLLFLSTKGIDGIVQWDFAPKYYKLVDTALVDHTTMENTAAGNRFDELMDRFDSSFTGYLEPHRHLRESVFIGDYDVHVIYDDCRFSDHSVRVGAKGATVLRLSVPDTCQVTDE